MRLEERMTRHKKILIISLASLTIVAWLLSLLLAASASPQCLTEKQARRAHPKAEILRKKDKCWVKVETFLAEPEKNKLEIWYPSNWKDEPIYSTFPGEPPDVWPVITDE